MRPTIHTTLPKDVLDFIKSEAKIQNVPQSTIITQAIREYKTNLSKKTENECIKKVLRGIIREEVKQELEKTRY